MIPYGVGGCRDGAAGGGAVAGWRWSRGRITLISVNEGILHITGRGPLVSYFQLGEVDASSKFCTRLTFTEIGIQTPSGSRTFLCPVAAPEIINLSVLLLKLLQINRTS